MNVARDAGRSMQAGRPPRNDERWRLGKGKVASTLPNARCMRMWIGRVVTGMSSSGFWLGAALLGLACVHAAAQTTIRRPAAMPAGARPLLTVGCAGATPPADIITGCKSGSADDVAINAAFAQLGSGGGSVVLQPGTYHLNPLAGGGSNIVAPTGNIDFSGAALGATILLVDPNPNVGTCSVSTNSLQTGNAVGIQNASNVAVHDMTIDGGLSASPTGSVTAPAQCPGSNDNVGNALRMDNATNVATYNLEVRGAYAHGHFVNCVSGNCQTVSTRNIISHDNGQIGLHAHADDAGLYRFLDFDYDTIYSYDNSRLAAVPYAGNHKQYGGVWLAFQGDEYGTVANVVSHDEPGPCVVIRSEGANDSFAFAQTDVTFTNITARACGTDNAAANNQGIEISPNFASLRLNNLTVDGSTGDCIGLVGLAPLAAGFTNGSTAVGVTSATPLIVGQYLNSASLPAGTFVTSVDSATQITVSANATATTPGLTGSFTPYGVANSLRIDRGRLTGCGGHGINITGSRLQDFRLTGMDIASPAGLGIYLQAAGPGQEIELSGNKVTGAGSTCLAVTGTAATPFAKLDIHDNSFVGCTGNNVFLAYVNNFNFVGNTLLDASSQQLSIGNASHGNITGNIMGAQSAAIANTILQLQSTTTDMMVRDNMFVSLIGNNLAIYSQGASATITGNHGVSTNYGGILLGTTSTGNVTWLNQFGVTNTGTGAGVAANRVGGAYAATTPAIGGGLLAAGACTAPVTLTLQGVTNAMTPSIAPVTDPGPGFYPQAFVPAANTVSARVCSVAGGTPASTAYAISVPAPIP